LERKRGRNRVRRSVPVEKRTGEKGILIQGCVEKQWSHLSKRAGVKLRHGGSGAI